MTHVHLQEGFTDHADFLQSLRIVGSVTINSFIGVLILLKISSNKGGNEFAELGLDLVDGDVRAPDDHGGGGLAVLRRRNNLAAGRKSISLGTSSYSHLS